MKDIGQDNRYVFISDQQKGLVAVFEEMKGKYHCTTCGEPGHNTGSCKKPQDPNALKRKRKPTKGKAKADAASDSQDPAAASQAPASASQDTAGVSQGTASASQVTAAASQAPASASQDPVGVSQGTASASQDPDGSQVVDAEASQDLFSDIPDEVMASIPEISQVKQTEKKMPVKPKKKKLKVEHHQPLYHGQRRRTSTAPTSQGTAPASQGTAAASQGTASASQCPARDLLLH
ncbi:hypothetical protein P8452_13348 [Trifolium repens]|nr:hypothetical protein P8452_13348 [Trifolium repens]